MYLEFVVIIYLFVYFS